MQKLTTAFAILFGACSLNCVAAASANSAGSEYRPQSSQSTPGGQAGNPSYSAKRSAKAKAAKKHTSAADKEQREDKKSASKRDVVVEKKGTDKKPEPASSK